MPQARGAATCDSKARSAALFSSGSGRKIIQTVEQMPDRFFGLVAHVGEAEGLAFEFAVAAVDDEVMFFSQIAHEFGDVDTAIVPHAGERDGAIALFGEEAEISRAHPFVDEPIGPGVTRVPVGQTFGEDFIKL